MSGDKELVGRVIIDASDATSGANQAAKAIGTVVDAFEEAEEASGKFVDASGRMREANGRFAQGAGAAAQQTTAFGRALAPLGVNFDKLIGKINPANVAMLAFSAAQKAAAIAIDLATTALIATTAAVVSLGVAAGVALTKYAEFETAFARVTTILEKGTVSAGFLSDQVRDLAIALGVDASEAARALADAIGSGIDPTESIPFLAEALKAAKAGFTEAGPVVKAFAGIISSYGMSAKDAGRVSDILFQTVKVGVTTIKELSADFGRIAPLASAAGVSLEEAAAAVATLTVRGFSTAEAVTGLRGILSAIIKPADGAREALERMGATADDLREVGLAEVLKRIGDATGGTADGLTAVIRRVEAANAAAVLASAGYEDFTRTIGLMKDASGSAGDALAIVAETLNAQWSRAVVIVEDAVISIGEILAPFASELLTPIIAFGERSAAEFRGLRNIIEEMTREGGGFLKGLGIEVEASGGIITMTLDLVSRGIAYAGELITEWAGPINFIIDSITIAVTNAYGAFKLLGYYVDLMLAPFRGLLIALESVGIKFGEGVGAAERMGSALRVTAAEVKLFSIEVANSTIQMQIHNAAITQTNAMLAQNKAAMAAAAEATRDKTRAVSADQEAVSELLKEEAKAIEQREKAAEKDRERIEKEMEAGRRWAEQKIEEHEKQLRREEEAAAKAEERAARASAANDREAASIRRVRGEFDDYFRDFERKLAQEQGTATPVEVRRRNGNDAGASIFGLNGPSFGFSSRPSGGSSIFGLGSFERGGRIPATGPINAHAAEFMLPAPAAAALGPSTLEGLRTLRPGSVTIGGPTINIQMASSVSDPSEFARSLAPHLSRIMRLGLHEAGVRF